MTLDQAAIRAVAARLEAAGIATPEVDARRLLAHAAEMATADHRRQRQLLDELVARRVAREPLQQILERTWFRTLELEMAPGVFVPRPETEIVAGIAIEAALAAGPKPKVVDVGTGSGAIACAIVVEVPGAHVAAVEPDPVAAALARRNGARTLAGEADPQRPPPTGTLDVLEGGWLDPVPAAWRGHLDVLVSNPPYLPAHDRRTWMPEVADHDPEAALVGGEDGHEVVDRLLALATEWLRAGGTVVVEIDDRRGADAAVAARAAGLAEVRLVTDLTGRDRAVTAIRAS